MLSHLPQKAPFARRLALEVHGLRRRRRDFKHVTFTEGIQKCGEAGA